MKDEQAMENTEENTLQEEMVNEAAQAESAEAQEAAVNDTESAAAEPHASTQELDRLKALAEENEKRYLRAQADFDNFRRRTQKEKEDLAKYASVKLITELVPVIDNFERAIATAPANTETDSFAKGVGMIFRQLESVLQAEGLTAMQTVGEAFNPEFHQAIMQVESEEHEEGVVVEEVQKGYMLKDKVLRPAMVKVSM